MNDPIVTLFRIAMLLFVPLMLLFPLAFVLFTPLRVEGDVARSAAHRRVLILALGSVVAIGIWLGFAIAAAQMQSSQLQFIANFSWVLFFPLWFGLGMPAIRARNRVWSGALDGSMSASTSVRSASLVNRSKESPITRSAWAVFVVVIVGLLALIAARGLMPFADETIAGEGATKHRQWLVVLGVYAICSFTTLMAVPYAIRRTSDEPEPLDPSGSRELMDLYRSQRRRKTLMLFWMLGVGLPAFMGAVLAASVWAPTGSGSLIGIVGAVGGSLIGIAGGVFGTRMTLERVHIAEVKARLEAAQGGHAV